MAPAVAPAPASPPIHALDKTVFGALVGAGVEVLHLSWHSSGHDWFVYASEQSGPASQKANRLMQWGCVAVEVVRDVGVALVPVVCVGFVPLVSVV